MVKQCWRADEMLYRHPVSCTDKAAGVDTAVTLHCIPARKTSMCRLEGVHEDPRLATFHPIHVFLTVCPNSQLFLLEVAKEQVY